MAGVTRVGQVGYSDVLPDPGKGPQIGDVGTVRKMPGKATYQL
jgi:hypothetical protein